MNHLTRLASALALACLPDTRAFAQVNGRNGAFWHDHDRWGHMMFGGVGMILFWGIIVVLIVLLVRVVSGGSASRARTPMEILQERFAKGEISKEEYEERRKMLSN
jgi:putative membrane protein